jgi:hypothetical protein
MNENTSKLVAAVVSDIVGAGEHSHKSATLGAQLSRHVSELFAAVNGSDVGFVEVFGNGRPSKAADFIPGTLAAGVKAKTDRMKDAERVKSILHVLKQRLYEARALRKAGGMPAKDESVQAALKRYKAPKAATPAAEPAKPAEPVGAVIIPADASMDQVAEALSVWVAKHGAAATGLATKLKDFLPISVTRGKKAA